MERRDATSTPAAFVGQAPSPKRETVSAEASDAAAARLPLAAQPKARLPGADRTWVPKVELPMGGGAIQAVGEKVEAHAFTGSAGYTIAIPTPSARGVAPALALAYGSGGGNGPFGVGWSLSVPAITRMTDRALPQYADGRESDTFILAGAEDLVPLADAAGERVVIERDEHHVYPYRPRVEGLFARIERWVRRTDGDTHWRVITRDDVTSWYGQSAEARLFDPEDPARVFSWLLQETRDDRGNVTRHEYKAEEASALAPSVAELNRGPTTNRYLKRVRWGNGTPDVADDFVFELVFDFGEHGEIDATSGRVFATPEEDRPWPARADAFSTFRAGFDVRTRRLCRRVLVFHRFAELGDGATLVGSLDLEYDESTHLARLVAATRRAYERDPAGGYVAAEFPSVRLRYSEARLAPRAGTLDARTLAVLPRGVDGNEFRFVDLDAEGLPGIVAELGETLYYHRPEGHGRFAGSRAFPSQSSIARLGDNAQLADVDGDGRLELAVAGEGFHARRGPRDWAPFVAFAQQSTVSFADPRLRQVDLDGDGLPDLLFTESERFVWIPSLGRRGYGRAVHLPKPGDERAGPAVAFDDATGRIMFADMTGDGLQDIVRVESGGVHYWPNLGRGRFGRRVTMDGSPFFAAKSEFEPRRIRLGDLDGSGTTDIVYLDERGARVWLNESGNRWAAPQSIRGFPGVHETTAAEIVDLLGAGTSCLVWSEASDWAKPVQVRWLELMAAKPHLLVEVDNGVGLQTRIAYEPSTVQYLRDRAAGQPWITRLPFPVHVVVRIEHADLVARRRFVQRYAYHHGHYDGVEREFHGFACVERWDAESFEDFNHEGLFSLELFDTVEAQLHQPPVYTRSWFHTGAYVGGGTISRQLELEYWAEDPQAWMLTDTVLPPGLLVEEAREACRALRGRGLREEVYAIDGSTAAGIPYAVTESNFVVRRLQAQGSFAHAVFLVHERESLAYHYERIVADPRIAHNLVLEVDDYGNPTRAASVAYPRRLPGPGMPEQGRRSIVVSESSFAAFDDADEPDVYRASVPVESRTYELLGFEEAAPVERESLRGAVSAAVRDVPEAPDPDDGVVHLRLLGAARSFYSDDDGLGALPLGDCGARALVREIHGAAFSFGQVSDAFGADVDASLLEDEGGYVADDGLWWARSPRAVYDPTRFYLSTAVFDPFGNPPTTIEYEVHALFAAVVTDAALNRIQAEYDYRVLAPRLVADPNANRTAVGFDTRGLVVWTAVMGKPGADEGDTEADPTTRFEYDLFAWRDRGEPNFAHAWARERHRDPTTRWLQHRTYSDGSGGVLLEKATAEPGPAPQRNPDGSLVLVGGATVDAPADPRWIGSGRVVVDNKGNPLKQYEPYFSSTLAYESETEVRERGVTPLMHYDPLGRLVRTDFPNGTHARTEFTPWLQRTFDTNDTVLDSDWHAARVGLPPGDPERRSAEITEAHASTAAIAHFDALGRTFLTVEDPGTTPLETRLVLDVVGNVREVIDARGNTADARVFGMLQQMLESTSIDAGIRRALTDVGGALMRSWNSRGFVSRVAYDMLRRPTHLFVTPPGSAEMLVTRTLWGEDVASAEVDNLRTRVFRVYDGAGVLTSEAFDFKGNPLRQSRRLAVGHEITRDWLVLEGPVPQTPAAIASIAEPELEAETFAFAMEYDALNRVTSRMTPDDSESLMTYNEAGLLEALAVHIGGAASATTFVSDFDYNARGQRLQCVHGNGTTATYEYDPQTFRLSRLRLVRDSAPTVSLQDLRYTYDPVGNITQIRDGAQQTIFFSNAIMQPEELFEYDPLYRLIMATGREHMSLSQPTHLDISFGPQPGDPLAIRHYTEHYVWDEVGNMLELQHVAAGGNFTRQYVYADDGNRLLSSSAPGQSTPPFSHSYTYDAHGNMTSMPHLAALGWDHADRLQHCDLGGGGDVWFVYDAPGNRVRKVQVNQSGSTTRERIYLGDWEVWRERTGAGMQQERETLHITDDGGRICLVETLTIDDGHAVGSRGSIHRYQHGNHLGSVALELDENAAVISYEEFHPFGTTSYAAHDSTIEVSAKRYRYIGKERDEETGLDHLGARYYASWLGRWISSDPFGLVDGPARYSYAKGNPTRLKDPSGTRAAPDDDGPPEEEDYSYNEDLNYEDEPPEPSTLESAADAFVDESGGFSEQERAKIRAAIPELKNLVDESAAITIIETLASNVTLEKGPASALARAEIQPTMFGRNDLVVSQNLLNVEGAEFNRQFAAVLVHEFSHIGQAPKGKMAGDKGLTGEGGHLALELHVLRSLGADASAGSRQNDILAQFSPSALSSFLKNQGKPTALFESAPAREAAEFALLSVALSGLANPSSLTGPEAAGIFGGLTGGERRQAIQEILLAGGRLGKLQSGGAGSRTLAGVRDKFFGVATTKNLISLGLGDALRGTVPDLLRGELDVTGLRLLEN